MAHTKESSLTNAVARELQRTWPEAFVWKVHGGPMQTAGIPDLAACIRGRYVAIEVKLQGPGESREHALSRVTELQQARIDEITHAGGIAGVALTPGEALEMVTTALDEQEIA